MDQIFILKRANPRAPGGIEVLGILREPDLSAVQAPGAMPTDAALEEVDSVTTASGTIVIALGGRLLEVDPFDFAAWTARQETVDDLVMSMSPEQRTQLGLEAYEPESVKRAKREEAALEARARSRVNEQNGGKA